MKWSDVILGFMGMASFNPAGGFRYHARAFAHRSSIWKPYVSFVDEWFSAWLDSLPKPLGSLIIVGPSAGYSLPVEKLRMFSSIQAVEPDPLARILFRMRLGRQVQWIESPFKTHSDFTLNAAALTEWIERHKDSSLLFSNILGQLHVLFPEAVRHSSFENWKNVFNQTLMSREKSWASYHDVLSGPLAPKINSLEWFDRALSAEEVTKDFYQIEQGHSVVMEDHYIFKLFPDETLRRTYFPWELAPENYHLVESVFKAADICC